MVGRFSRFVSLFLVAFVLAVAFVALTSPGAKAEVTNFGLVGYVAYGVFEADFHYTWSSIDCMDGRLYFNGTMVASTGEFCPIYSGEPFSGYTFASVSTGIYRFDLYDTTSGQVIQTHGWTTPGVSVTFSTNPSTTNISETVNVVATMTLLPSGPDGYYTQGTLTVDPGVPTVETVFPSVFSDRYWGYYGNPSVPQYSTFTMTVPVSFSSAGPRTIMESYWDPATNASSSSSVTVADSAPITSLHQSLTTMEYLAVAALAIGIVGVVVGVIGLRTARKARQELASRVPPPVRQEPGPPPSPPQSGLPPAPPPG